VDGPATTWDTNPGPPPFLMRLLRCTSWMITVDEMEGERRKWPEEDRERDVGVSVCPWMELRMSNTYTAHCDWVLASMSTLETSSGTAWHRGRTTPL